MYARSLVSEAIQLLLWLHDPDVDPRDRFTDSVLLLFGKPVTRITRMAVAHHPDGGGTDADHPAMQLRG